MRHEVLPKGPRAFARDGFRGTEVLGVATLNSLNELVNPFNHAFGNVDGLDVASSYAAKGALQLRDGKTKVSAQTVNSRLNELVATQVSSKNTGERTSFHALTVVGRCLRPGVAIVEIADLVTIFLAQGAAL